MCERIIKYDFKRHDKSKNIPAETHCRGEPSGRSPQLLLLYGTEIRGIFLITSIAEQYCGDTENPSFQPSIVAQTRVQRS